MEGAEPIEPCTKKIWNCLRAEDEQVCTAHLLLWRDAPITTSLSEKGHGAGAGVKKHHPGLGLGMITSRQFAVLSRSLVARSKDELHARDGQVDNTEDRIMCIAPTSWSGESGGSSAGYEEASDTSAKIISVQNQLYDPLPEQEKIGFAERNSLLSRIFSRLYTHVF